MAGSMSLSHTAWQNWKWFLRLTSISVPLTMWMMTRWRITKLFPCHKVMNTGILLPALPLFPVIFNFILLAKLMAGLKKEAVDSFLSQWLPVSSCSSLGHMTNWPPCNHRWRQSSAHVLEPTLRLALLLVMLGSDNLKWKFKTNNAKRRGRINIFHCITQSLSNVGKH